VQRIAELHEPNAKISRHETPLPHLHIKGTEGGIASDYPLTVVEQTLTKKFLSQFIHHIVKRYRKTNPHIFAALVYGGDPPSDAVRQQARNAGVRLYSLVEYQGLLDFSAYLAKQTQLLENSPIYPPRLYVAQRLREANKAEEEHEALPTVRGWLDENYARFILVLGDFGTGKTFLLRELARQLGEEQGMLVPILLQMRQLEKNTSLEKLVAQQLSDMEFKWSKFRYLLEQGRVVLLFDGYDELALRVTYEKAMAHFDTLLEATTGQFSKVVVTSRTQHFISDKEVKLRLWDKADAISGCKIVFLEKFSQAQIRQFLINYLQDEKKAELRLTLIEQIEDLMGLSANPRMLSFIAQRV